MNCLYWQLLNQLLFLKRSPLNANSLMAYICAPPPQFDNPNPFPRLHRYTQWPFTPNHVASPCAPSLARAGNISTP